METILFIGIVIIIFIVLGIQSSIKENRSALKRDIDSLNNKLADIKIKLEQFSSMPTPSAIDIKKEEEQKAAAEAKAQQEQLQKIAQLEELRKQREIKKKHEEEILLQQKITSPEEAITIAEPSPLIESNFVVQESWWDKWMRNNPDIEKFIGENLINKIGIAVLVLGIAFFVKYAIDKDWIKEWGRIAIGIGCGAILIGIAHYLRNSYRAFSSVLVGGGLAVFYFTIAFAYHQYNLIAQTPAFIIMIIITIFAVILALLYDKLELAVIAAIGGFIAPFLVSNGDGNYIALFTYLIILNVGLLTLSYFKKWPLINILSLFFTVLIYGLWMGQIFGMNDKIPPYSNALLFATIFYSLFLAMNMIHNIRYQKPFKAFDFFVLLLINCSFYSAGMIILTAWHNGDYKGIFTICMGAVNFGLAFYFFKTHKGDRNLLYLLIGLTLSFISLAAPVQLHGHAITLFWSAEAVLLFWLHQRSGIRIFKYSSIIITALMLVSLVIDWVKAYEYNTYQLSVIFTNLQGIVTNLVAAVSFALYYFLLKKEDSEEEYIIGIPVKIAKVFMISLSVLLLYLTCIFSVNLHFGNLPDYIRVNPYYLLITDLFALAVIISLQKFSPKSIWLQTAFIIVCYAIYLFNVDKVFELRNATLTGLYSPLFYVIHWITDICLLYLLYKAIQLFRLNTSFKEYKNAASWGISGALVIFFSVESLHLYVSIGYHTNNIDYLQGLFKKAGLTILWAVCSFIIMWLGMRHSYKTFRIISLSLFSIALLKLFLFDIQDVSEGGKIAAFIMLGILLLSISFMYQKLKKIIIDEKPE